MKIKKAIVIVLGTRFSNDSNAYIVLRYSDVSPLRYKIGVLTTDNDAFCPFKKYITLYAVARTRSGYRLAPVHFFYYSTATPLEA